MHQCSKAKNVSFFWLIIAIGYSFWGFLQLYKYSEPGIFWLYQVPAVVAYSKLYIGASALVVSLYCFKLSPIVLSPFGLLVFIYSILGVNRLYGEVLALYICINSLVILLIIYTRKHYLLNLRPENEILFHPISVGYIAVGLFPYLFPEIFSYTCFRFLH